MNSVKSHFDAIAGEYDFFKEKNWYYYQTLKNIYAKLIPCNKKVLEIGCGTGDILANLDPQYGLGIDISSKMIEIAKQKYKNNTNLCFEVGLDELKDKSLLQGFDFVFMADVVEHLENANNVLKEVTEVLNGSELIITMANPLWEPLLLILERLGLKMPEGPHSRMSVKKLKEMMESNGIKVVSEKRELIFPVFIPILSNFLNKWIIKLPFINRLGLIIVIVGKK